MVVSGGGVVIVVAVAAIGVGVDFNLVSVDFSAFFDC